MMPGSRVALSKEIKAPTGYELCPELPKSKGKKKFICHDKHFFYSKNGKKQILIANASSVKYVATYIVTNKFCYPSKQLVQGIPINGNAISELLCISWLLWLLLKAVCCMNYRRLL